MTKFKFVTNSHIRIFSNTNVFNVGNVLLLAQKSQVKARILPTLANNGTSRCFYNSFPPLMQCC